MSVSKNEFEQELAAMTGLTQAKASEVVGVLAEIAYREANDGFSLPGFGEFRLVPGEEREGTNPFTGKPVIFKSPPSIQFTPDSEAEEKFRQRRGTPASHAASNDDFAPTAEVALYAENGSQYQGNRLGKVGGDPEWVQADETPTCCGVKSQFCGQLDLASVGGPEMLYVFFCNRCYSPSSIYQCT